MFGLFKRKSKQEAVVSGAPALYQLDINSVLSIDLNSWQVVEAYEYDWGDEHFTRDFKLDSGTATCYLSIEPSDPPEYIQNWQMKFSALGEDVVTHFRKHQTGPSSIDFDGDTYVLDAERPGYCTELGEDEWEPLVAYDYYTADGTKCVSIEQYDEGVFEASHGIVLDAERISDVFHAS